jgi:hypothetical protein
VEIDELISQWYTQELGHPVCQFERGEFLALGDVVFRRPIFSWEPSYPFAQILRGQEGQAVRMLPGVQPDARRTSMDRHLTTTQQAADGLGQELFGGLSLTEIVGRPRDDDWHAVGPPVGHGDVF